MKSLWLWPGLLLVLVATAWQLHRQGRLWLCACGRLQLWTGDVWSADNSQHLFDPYSFTHLLHGFVFCALLAWGTARLSTAWRLWLAVVIEALWEIVENSEFVIRRYREATAALGYQGDTIVNSLGDIVACGLGFLLARQLGFRRALAISLIIEAVLLIWIRDSLLLNVLMLLYPIEEIRLWQTGH